MQRLFMRERIPPIVPSTLLVTLILLCFVFPGFLFAQDRKYLPQDLFSVSFPTERDGWACGRWGMITHTNDGGKTWERQTSGTDFTLSSICFTDAKQGWTVGDGGIILHTANGGQTWKKQKGPQILVEAGARWGHAGFTAGEEKTEAVLFYMGVDFVNSRKGWIVGERTHVLHTEDGGNTWEIQFSDEDFILKSVSFCDEYNGWAVGEYGYVYHTSDGGISWEHQAGEFDFSDETGEIVGGNFLFDVVAVNPQTAWVAGIDGYVAKTVDAGATWQQVTEGIPKAHLFGITADDQGNVLIGGNAQLLSSSDGGASFKVAKAEPPITYGWLYHVTSRGGKGFAAVGRAEWVYLSDNNGISWQRAGGS